MALLQGLSPQSVFKQLVDKTPRRVDENEAAALMARA